MKGRAPPPRIFLSYRREDTSGHAGRLYDAFAERFGEEHRNPGELGLDLAVRISNNSPYDANFWSASFRLDVDGAKRAPTNDLNEVVPGGTTSEGKVAFAVPESARALALVVANKVRSRST